MEYNTNAGDNEVAAAHEHRDSDKAGTQRTYHYSARNLGILGPKGCLWRSGAQDGQNDLRWYTAKQGLPARGRPTSASGTTGRRGVLCGHLHNP